TVFLVSHDRRFLDNVVTSTLVSEGDGRWREYVGDVQDWLTQSARALARASTSNAAATVSPPKKEAERAPVPAETGARRKLSYKEQRELDALPQRIAALEAEQAALSAELGDGSLYGSQPARAAELAERLVAVEEEWLA